jgi:hypothetical protein
MSQENGVPIIRLGRKGVRKFQFDEDTPIVELDVIHCWNQWLQIERSFRDEKGDVPPEKNPEVNMALNDFACAMLQVQAMSDANALEFQAILGREVDKLLPFFDVKSSEEPSSQPNSTTVVFST